MNEANTNVYILSFVAPRFYRHLKLFMYIDINAGEKKEQKGLTGQKEKMEGRRCMGKNVLNV